MPTVAPGVDPTMMRAPAAVATTVLPASPVVSASGIATPNMNVRSTEKKTPVRASGRVDQPASNAHASMNDSLASSMTAVPRRRIGVFLAALLIFDAGLATAGALMMRSALGRANGAMSAPPTTPLTSPPQATGNAVIPAAAIPPPANAPANAPATPATSKTVAVPTAATSVDAAVTAAGSGNASSVAGPGGALGGAGANVQISSDKTSAAVQDLEKGGAKSLDKKTAGAGPVDPYATSAVTPPTVLTPGGVASAEPPVPSSGLNSEQTPQEESLVDQVRRREVGSRARFARCYSTSAKASDTPLTGAVTVAFQVTANGRVINANAVDNSTESLSLARCVVAEVTKWAFAAGAGDAQDFVRVFTFEGQ